MSLDNVKKAINRVNHFTLNQKRALREAFADAYTDLADTNTFVGSDYYISSDGSGSLKTIDATLGYETGLDMGFPTSIASQRSSGFTSENGLAYRAVTAAADSVANAGVDTTFTTGAAHGLVVGDTVTLSGFGGDEGYNGIYLITTVPSTTTFDVTTPYTADLTGGVVKPDLLTCATTGLYNVSWSTTLESDDVATGNGYLKWLLNTDNNNGFGLRTAIDINAINIPVHVGGSFSWDATAGDTLCLSIASVNWGADVKLTQLNISVTRVA